MAPCRTHRVRKATAPARPNQPPRRRRLAATLAALALGISTLAEAQSFRSPDILVLGDSQIAFGAGTAFLAFFSSLERQCASTRGAGVALAAIDTSNTAVIGVRSTSVDAWVARDGEAKAKICGVDPNWNRNAGTYGVVNRGDDKYVQIGEGAAYQFCVARRSPFEAMFRAGYYRPKLLVLSFLGVSARRWAERPDLAHRDIDAMNRQLPPDSACVFITTAPGYRPKSVELRERAQRNVARAFARSDGPCTYVAGMTPATIAANLGKAEHFRRNAAGEVIDPFHPNPTGSAQFLALQRDALCAAITRELRD